MVTSATEPSPVPLAASLEAETTDLLARPEHLDPELTEWLWEASYSAARRLRSESAARLAPDQASVR